jgi:hypothetical protein
LSQFFALPVDHGVRECGFHSNALISFLNAAQDSGFSVFNDVGFNQQFLRAFVTVVLEPGLSSLPQPPIPAILGPSHCGFGPKSHYHEPDLGSDSPSTANGSRSTCRPAHVPCDGCPADDVSAEPKQYAMFVGVIIIIANAGFSPDT